MTFDQPSATGQFWQTTGTNGRADYNPTVLGTITAPPTGLATITFNSAGIADLAVVAQQSVLELWLRDQEGTSTARSSSSSASSKYATVADRPIAVDYVRRTVAPLLRATLITNPVTSATAAVNGTSGSPGYMSGIGLNLATLYYQYLQYQQSGSTSGFTPNLSQAGINAADISGTNVAIYVTSESTTVSQLTSSLESLGMNGDRHVRHDITGCDALSRNLPMRRFCTDSFRRFLRRSHAR